VCGISIFEVTINLHVAIASRKDTKFLMCYQNLWSKWWDKCKFGEIY